MAEFTIEPRGTFSLAAAQRFLGGFTPAAGTFADDATGLTMAFPVDGWAGSAGAVVWQDGQRIRAIVGQRISMRQAATIKTAVAKDHGQAIDIGGQRLNAFAQER